MAIRQPRYSTSEFSQRGTQIYERDIRPRVEADNQGKFVAIDIESGEWEMDEDDYTAGERLAKRVPDAQTWMVCVGRRAAYRIGGSRRTDSQ